MCEPPWRTELAQIQKDEEVQYIAAIFTWFQWWRIRRGVWPLLPRSEFNLSKEMRDRVNSCLTLTLVKVEMLMGEMQALKVLITLQCIAEAGPRKPTPGYVCQCMESIMHPLSAIGIAFSAHSILASAASSQSRSTSLKMDISLTDLSSLPSSVGSARDLAQKADQKADMEVSTAGAEVPTGIDRL